MVHGQRVDVHLALLLFRDFPDDEIPPVGIVRDLHQLRVVERLLRLAVADNHGVQLALKGLFRDLGGGDEVVPVQTQGDELAAVRECDFVPCFFHCGILPSNRFL